MTLAGPKALTLYRGTSLDTVTSAVAFAMQTETLKHNGESKILYAILFDDNKISLSIYI